MGGIGGVSHLPAVRGVAASGRLRGAGRRGSDTPEPGRTEEPAAAAADWHSRATAPGDYAPFLVQSIANDNGLLGDAAPAGQGAIAYLIARDRGRDLPVGFLLARSV